MYCDDFEDENQGSHEDGIKFSQENQVKYKRKSADVDYLEGFGEKIFWIWASDPIFFFDG